MIGKAIARFPIFNDFNLFVINSGAKVPLISHYLQKNKYLTLLKKCKNGESGTGWAVKRGGEGEIG